MLQVIHLGANLIPENLETGEYKVQGTAEIEDLNPCAIIAYSEDKIKLSIDPEGTTPTENNLKSFSKIINGMPSTIHFLCIPNFQGFSPFINYMNFDNQLAYIVACFTVPYLAVKDLCINANKLSIAGGDIIGGVYVLTGKQTEVIQNLIQLPSSIDGYSVKNQKLRTFPYTYLGFNPPQRKFKSI